MRRAVRLAVAWLALALSVGIPLALGLHIMRSSSERFQVADAPATIALVPGQNLSLDRPGARDGRATCTIAPVRGESREVTVTGTDDPGYRVMAWWSGVATVTCDGRVDGTVLVADHTRRMAIAVVVGLVAMLGFATLFGRLMRW